jgi:hypothetical protein
MGQYLRVYYNKEDCVVTYVDGESASEIPYRFALKIIRHLGLDKFEYFLAILPATLTVVHPHFVIVGDQFEIVKPQLRIDYGPRKTDSIIISLVD